MPVTVRGTDILFNDGTTQNTAASTGGTVTVSAGTNYQAGGGFVQTDTTFGSMTKVLATKMLVAGTVRVQWSMYQYTSNLRSRVYKNGVAVGTERASTNTNSYTAYTEDVSVAIGDRIEIYARSTDSYSTCIVGGINIGCSQNYSFGLHTAYGRCYPGNYSWAVLTTS